MSQKIQLKRGSSATFQTLNPVLLKGEPAIETDTNKMKIGDGVTSWNDLSYINPAIEAVDGGEFLAPPVPTTPGSFSPPDLEGLVLWMDATHPNYIHSVNNKVSLWEDMSAERTRFVQSQKVNRPLISNQIEDQDVVSLDGDNDVMISNFQLPEEFTLLVAFRRAGVSEQGRLLSVLDSTDDSDDFVLCGTESGSSFGFKVGEEYAGTQSVDDLVTVIYTLKYSSGSMTTRLNGLNAQSEAVNLDGDYTRFSIGGSRVDFSEGNFSGDIAEIVMYDAALSDADLFDAENYLMARWGIMQVSHPLLEGMKAFWRLNEESGDRIDITDAAVELTATGTVGFEDGVIGNAAKFTGGSNYLTAPETLVLEGSFSVSLWFKTASITDAGLDPPRIIQNWAGGLQGQMTLGFGDEAGDIGSVWAYVRTTDDSYRVAMPDLESNRWHHVVMVFDETNNKVQLYVDGTLANQTTTWGSLATSNIPLRVGIGEQTAVANSAAFFLDQLGIWNRVLSVADVEMLYNDELGKEDFTADLFGDNVSLLLHADKPANAVETIGGGGSSTLLNGLEAFWKFDDLEDMTGNGYTLTNINDATFTPGKVGNALTIDAYSGLQYAKISNFKILRAAGFSISGWVRSDDTSEQTNPWVLSHGVPFGFCNGSLVSFSTWEFSAGHNACPGTPSTAFNIQHPDGIDACLDGNWHHAVGTFDGSTAKFYVDNVLIGTQTGLVFDDAWPVPDAFFGGGIGEYARTGQIDAVGYWTRALTEAEIAELYNNGNGTETFAPPGDPDFANVSLLLPLDADFSDTSQNDLTVAPNGNPTISALDSKFGGASAKFNGNGDRLDIATNELFNLSGGDYTVECFFNPTDLSGPDAARLWTFENDYESWGLLLANDGSGWIAMNHFGVPVVINSSNGVMTTGTWYHVVLVRHNGVTTLYLNGTTIGSDSQYAWVPSGPCQLSLGGNIKNCCQYTNYNGYIDDFRVTKGVARYTADFTPPTTAFAFPTQITPIPGIDPAPALLLHFDGTLYSTTFTDSSLNKLSLPVLSGSPQITTSDSKFGGACLLANGGVIGFTNDTSQPLVDFTGGDFTIEAWVWRPIGAGDATIFGCGNGGSAGFHFWIDSSRAVHADNFQVAQFVGGLVPEEQWTHIAAVNQSGTYRVYIDGVLAGSAAGTPGAGPFADVYIGGWGSFLSNTLLDELRITKGLALYTSNFTPPTAAFPDPVPNPALLIHCDGGFFDSSLYAHEITNNNVTVHATDFIANGTAFNTAGLFDPYFQRYLSIPDAPEFDLSSGAFCVELRFAALGLGTDIDVDAQVLISKDQNGVSYSWGISITHTQIRVATANIAGDWDFLVSQAVTENTWHHLALTGDGTTMKLFFNGNLIGTKNRTLTNASADITIGCGSYNNPVGFFNGAIEEVRVVKGAQVYTANFTPPAAAFENPRAILPLNDPDSASVSLLLNMNGADGSTTFTDSSNNALTVTANGATISTSQSKFGGASAYFDGQAGTLLSAPSSADFAFDGDFTVEAWVYRTGNGTVVGGTAFAQIATALGGGDATGWTLFISDGININFLGSTGNGWQTVIAGPATVPLNQWCHVSVTRAGSDVKIFINGVETVTGTSSDAIVSGTNVYVGSYPLINGYAPASFAGYIDDLRITKGVARYTTNFYPPQQQFVVSQGGVTANANLLLHFDGANNSTTFTDDSVNDLTPTVTGVVISTAQNKFGGSSGYFNGANVSTLVYEDSPLFGFGTGDFTIEMFTYREGGTRDSIISVGTYQNGILWRLNETNADNLYLNLTATQMSWDWPAGGTGGAGGTVPLNAWAHIALTRQNNVVRVFVDGVKTFEEDLGVIDLGASRPLTVGCGAHEYNSTDAYYGYIDDLRIIKGAAVYTADFTPPTAPLSASTGGGGGQTQYITTFIDSSKHNHELTANGDARLDLEEIKYGNATGKFNAGHCSLPMSPEFAFGTGDFTVEFWGKLTYTASAGVFSIADSTQDAGTYLIGFRNDANMFGFCYDIDNFTFVSANIAAYYDTWAHYAFVRLDGVLKMYINGVEVGTANTTIDLDGGAQTTAVIGRRWVDEDDYYLEGHIDDFRITKGVARYISSFNPPTKAFPDPVLVAPPAPDSDPYAEYVTLLLHMDGANGSTSFIDNSYLQNTVTAEGAATVSTVQSKFGGASVYFSNENSWLNTNKTGKELYGETEDFTIECWVQPADLSNQRVVFGSRPESLYLDDCIVLAIDTNGFPFVHTNATAMIQSSISILGGAWAHLAVTRRLGNFYLYVNGTLAGEYVAGQAYVLNASALFFVGAEPRTQASGNVPFLGYIDDFRITKGVARYTTNFTPPTAAFLNPFEPSVDAILLLHFDGTNGSAPFTDSGPNDVTLTPETGVTISTAQSKFGGASGAFNNSGALNVTGLPADYLGGDFTIEAWVWLNNTLNQMLLNTDPHNSLGISLNRDATGKTHVFIGDGINWLTSIESNDPLSYNEWHHVAVVRSGTTLTLYHDGVEQATTNTGPTGFGTDAKIGGATVFGGEFIDGYVDEFRITGAAVYTADFTPPTAPFTPTAAVTPADITGCDLWLDSTADITEVTGAIATWPDKSGNGRTATPADYAPAPTVAAGEGPNGQDVVRFSGDPNVLDVSYQFNLKNSSAFVLLKQPTPFNAPSGFQRILGFQPATGLDSQQNDGLALVFNNYTVDGVELYSGGAPPIGQHAMPLPVDWTLLAYTIDNSGNLSLRVNGTAVATGVNASMAQTAGGNLYIGHGGALVIDDALTGDIAEIALFDHKLGPAALVGLEQGILARWLPQTPPNPNGDVILQLRMDSDFADTSGNNQQVDAANATVSSTQSKFGGGSGYFDGTGYLTCPAATGDLGAGDFTIECWIYPESMSSAHTVLMANFQNWGAAAPHWQILSNGTPGNLTFWAAENGSTAFVNFVVNPALNQWQHFAVTRQAGVLRVFLNGVSAGEANISLDFSSPTSPLWIGQSPENIYGRNWAGYIDDLRITKGAALYTANFPVPNLPAGADLTLLLHMDGTTFVDSSSKQHAILQYGYPTIASGTSKFGSGSLAMSGGEYIYAESPTDFNFGVGDFTVEFWFYPPATANYGAKTLMTTANPVDLNGFWVGMQNADSIHWLFGPNAAGNNWQFARGPYGGEVAIGVVNLDGWNHLAITRSNGMARLFINGALADSLADTTNMLNVNNNILIGGRSSAPDQYFTGYIDEVRVIKGVAMYESAFTPPTAPFPDPPVLPSSVLMHFDGPTLVDSSPTGLSFPSSSLLASFNSTTKQFGPAAFSYNGANDVYSTTRGVPNLTNGDFTVECWVYRPSDTATYAGVLFLHASDNNLSYQGGLNLYINQNGTVDCNNGFAAGLSGGSVPVGQWTHIAVVRIGETSTLYINGTSVNTNTQAFVAGPYILCLGFVPLTPGFESDLIIDELRIIKTAVYTGNFALALPTAPFTA